MRFRLVIIFFAGLFASCSEVQEITLVEGYSISLPSAMVETKTIKPDAEIQYQDLINNFFFTTTVIAIDTMIDSIGTEDLGQLFKYKVDDLRKLGTETYMSPVDTITVAGYKALSADFLRTTQGPEVYSKLILFKDSNHIFEISAWTLSVQKSEYKPKIDQIISSFRKNGAE